jgi:hypothetical protein
MLRFLAVARIGVVLAFAAASVGFCGGRSRTEKNAFHFPQTSNFAVSFSNSLFSVHLANLCSPIMYLPSDPSESAQLKASRKVPREFSGDHQLAVSGW